MNHTEPDHTQAAHIRLSTALSTSGNEHTPAWVYVGPTPRPYSTPSRQAEAGRRSQVSTAVPAPKRILAVKLADVGDTLLVTPALSALRSRFPDADLDGLVTPTGASVLRGSSLIRDLIEFEPRSLDRGRVLPGVEATADLWRSLRARAYDMILIFHHLTTRAGTVKHAALAVSTGAPVRAGLVPSGSRRGSFLTHRAIDLGFDGAHEVEAALAVAAAVGAEQSTGQLMFSPGGPAERRADELLSRYDAGGPPTDVWVEDTSTPARSSDGSGVRRVAIHPGTGPYSPARRWPAAYFADVAAAVAARGFEPVLVGTAGDRVDEVMRLLTVPALDLSGRTDLATLGAVLARCRALVCNDGGVMHLATAMGTPTVAVFGPSNPVAWGPWPGGTGSPHRVVALNLPCMPCFYVGHSLGARDGCPTRDCLAWLKPEWVVRALDDVLTLPGDARAAAQSPSKSEGSAAVGRGVR